jgi:hypothetical protein
MSFEPGMYEVISKVTIRRTPRIIEYRDATNHLITNAVGSYDIGTRVQVFSVLVDKHNDEWGRVSANDATGQAEWVCMKNTNRTFVKLLEPTPIKMENLEERLRNLEIWAQTKGYLG